MRISAAEVQDFARGISQTLRFSSDDYRLTAIAFAVVLAVVAIALLVVMVVRSGWVGHGARRSGLPEKLGRDGELGIVVVALVLALLYSLSAAHVSRSAVCATCHDRQLATSVGSTHSQVGCVGCHRSPGVLGFVLWNTDYVRWFLKSRNPRATIPVASSVPSTESCVNCHRSVVATVVVAQGMRVRHAELLHLSCTACHLGVGHDANNRAGGGSVMTVCISCHRSRRVKTDCDTCHIGDIASAGGLRTVDRAVTKVSTSFGTDCRGCHDTKRCRTCHGLEMPHPPGWVPSHARAGLVNKDVCWRCHPGPQSRLGIKYAYGMCNGCHRFPGPHGSPDQWIRNHGAAAMKRRSPARSVTRCGLCHRDERFCDLCHDGLREKVDYTNGQ